MTGSAGLCAALEEAQQRVGTDPNADADALSGASGLRERRERGGLFDSIEDAPGDDSEADSAAGQFNTSMPCPTLVSSTLLYSAMHYSILPLPTLV